MLGGNVPDYLLVLFSYPASGCGFIFTVATWEWYKSNSRQENKFPKMLNYSKTSLNHIISRCPSPLFSSLSFCFSSTCRRVVVCNPTPIALRSIHWTRLISQTSTWQGPERSEWQVRLSQHQWLYSSTDTDITGFHFSANTFRNDIICDIYVSGIHSASW